TSLSSLVHLAFSLFSLCLSPHRQIEIPAAAVPWRALGNGELGPTLSLMPRLAALHSSE
ncbi:unnamed protein product, partial [Urochloa humidicola]